MSLAAAVDLSRYDGHAANIAAWRNRSRRIRYTAYFILAALITWSIEAIVVGDTDWGRITWAGMYKSASQFMSVDLSIFGSLMEPALETALMATMGTLVGLVLAIPVAWLGASNISPLGRTTYVIGRGLMTLSRSVHEVVWGLIFVATVGLGALAGVLAMGIRSIGFISKTVAEAIEDVNPGPVEAMRAVGANRFQILLFGILPQVIPVFIGNVIFEWDVNIRRSTIMGLVGAGGLGLALHRQMAAYNYGGIATVLLVILLLIVAGEIASHYARKAVI